MLSLVSDPDNGIILPCPDSGIIEDPVISVSMSHIFVSCGSSKVVPSSEVRKADRVISAHIL